MGLYRFGEGNGPRLEKAGINYSYELLKSSYHVPAVPEFTLTGHWACE